MRMGTYFSVIVMGLSVNHVRTSEAFGRGGMCMCGPIIMSTAYYMHYGHHAKKYPRHPILIISCY